MKYNKQEIYSSTLDIMVKEIQVPDFSRVREQIKNKPNQKLIYDQYDRFDEIREVVAFFNPHLENCDLADGHAELIQNLEPFTVVGHLTFGGQITQKHVDWYFRRFIRKLGEEFVCKKYKRKKLPGIAWVRVIARQKRGVFHIHCLLDHPKLTGVPMERIRKIWHGCGKKVGKISEFKRYDPRNNMRFYLANHVHRGAEAEYSKKLDWQNRAHRGPSNLLRATHT